MAFNCIKIGNQWGIHLSGNFDLNAANVFKTEIIAAINDPVITRISVDFAGVSSIDSTGMGTLLFLREKALAAEKLMNLVCVKGHVRETLEQANFNLLFMIH
jgi:anti-anti-sigma factor